MGDYHDHYLKKYALLLAYVFEKFINTCLKFYKLDLFHYFSSLRLSWYAMLKMTGVNLEKIANINMYLCIEKGLRGGISYISKGYAGANNKYIINYDPTKPPIYISNIDTSNLYGWAMSSYLLYGGFKCLKNFDNFDVNSFSEKSPIGYILEVDLKYPDELHVLHPSHQILVPRTSRGYSPPKSAGRPLKILFDLPRDVPI